MPDLRSLTRMYWSAAFLHRRGAPNPNIKATLWHVAKQSHGALRTKTIAVLKEIINGNRSR